MGHATQSNVRPQEPLATKAHHWEKHPAQRKKARLAPCLLGLLLTTPCVSHEGAVTVNGPDALIERSGCLPPKTWTRALAPVGPATSLLF